MATGQGTAVIDFGTGKSETFVAVTGLSTISGTSKCDAFIMADDTTASHSASDHRYLACLAGFTCSTPTAGVGFTIYATSMTKLRGTFQVRYVWAD